MKHSAAPTSSKTSRHFAIKQIIAQHVVANQDELRLLLEAQGFETTQATLSRDLKELGIVRTHSAEGMRYVADTASEEMRFATLIGYEIEWIEANEQMVVVRTLPGRAAGVAEIIDSFRLPGVLGTIAGDNTIFIAPRSVRRISELVDELRRIVMSGGEQG